MAEFSDLFPQQQIAALSIRTGPEEKEVIQVEDLVRVAQLLQRQERGDHQAQLEEVARSGQEQLDKLRLELETTFLEVSKDGSRQVERRLEEKKKLLERLGAVRGFLEEHRAQIRKVDELKRKQEEVRDAGWAALRELTQKTRDLENLQRSLVIVQRQLLHKREEELKEEAPTPELDSAALQDLPESAGRGRACWRQATGQRDKLEEALRRKNQEVASLYRRFNAQKQEMAALEGKLQQQLREHEEQLQKKSAEKEEDFEKNLRGSEERFRKELAENQQSFRKELSQTGKAERGAAADARTKASRRCLTLTQPEADGRS